LQDITNQALVSARIDRYRIVGAGFGVAGYDWPSQLQPTLDGIATLRLNCPLQVVNDAVLGIFAGTTDGWGVAIVSGTGENCWGVDKVRNYGHMTGNSYLMGEAGGAGSIVYQAIREVAKEWGKRGPETLLSQAFVERVGASNLDDLLEGLVMERYQLSAADAPLVFEIAYGGDEIAINVIRWAGLQLADLVKGVVKQLNFMSEDFEVVLTGSTFKGGDLITSPMIESILKFAPKARFVHLEAPPVVGAVLLGMEQSGADGYLVRERLVNSTREIIHQLDE
jgi:N-acetylglucosamine kinase-like BadF-type ATPase